MLKRVEDNSATFEAVHSSTFLNHLVSISFILSPSVTSKIFLEMSGTKGEPIGNPWKRSPCVMIRDVHLTLKIETEKASFFYSRLARWT